MTTSSSSADPTETIAAGPGYPFAAGPRPVGIELRRCRPCAIETTEADCFGCGKKTESFVTIGEGCD